MCDQNCCVQLFSGYYYPHSTGMQESDKLFDSNSVLTIIASTLRVHRMKQLWLEYDDCSQQVSDVQYPGHTKD